jgi:CTP:molybdopterin cytidylyltransferase MocA
LAETSNAKIVAMSSGLVVRIYKSERFLRSSRLFYLQPEHSRVSEAIIPAMSDCVMPAAGASARMRAAGGTAGEVPRAEGAAPNALLGRPSGVLAAPNGGFKPLLPFGGSTLVEAAAAAALGAGCRLILVVGCRGDEVAAPFSADRYREAREAGRIVVVSNPRWEEGLLGSIQSALPLVRSEAFFIAHADMPFLRPEDYMIMAEARSRAFTGTADEAGATDAARVARSASETAFVASCGGLRGHPVLLPASWTAEISALPPADGLKAFLAGKSCKLVDIGSAALSDIDTPGDYERALRGRAAGRRGEASDP